MTSVDEFFQRYPQFDYHSHAPVMVEFKRLCQSFNWGDDSNKRYTAYKRLMDALALDFNRIYGTDVHDINAWRTLCQVIGISSATDMLAQCRKRVKAVHINIIDLVDTHRAGIPVKIFRSMKALSKYTVKENKIFPKKNAKAGGLLKYLLREIY